MLTREEFEVIEARLRESLHVDAYCKEMNARRERDYMVVCVSSREESMDCQTYVFRIIQDDDAITLQEV